MLARAEDRTALGGPLLQVDLLVAGGLCHRDCCCLADSPRRRRRLARANADGAFSDEEYADLKSVIEGQVRAAQRVTGPSYEEAAEILGDMPRVRERAQIDERRLLLAPLIERLYLDLAWGVIGGLQPTPACRGLLEHALRRRTDSRAVLLTEEETGRVMSRIGGVETGEIELLIQRRRELTQGGSFAKQMPLWG